jgi:hypothetical protein
MKIFQKNPVNIMVGHNPILINAVHDFLISCGYDSFGFDISNTIAIYVNWYGLGKTLTHNDYPTEPEWGLENCKKGTIHIDLRKEGWNKLVETFCESAIMIDEYKVEISKDSIKVGCKTISRKTVEEILIRMNKE